VYSHRCKTILAAALALAAALLAAPGTARAAAEEEGPHGPFVAAGKWIVDRQGRVVITHGFDIMKKTTPYYPSTFGDQDAQFLTAEGFTTARIGLIWAGVEPQPGVYDDAYIHQFIRFARLLERNGIRPLIDFHQDSWGTEGLGADACRSNGVCWIGGGDGAPAWATLGSSADANFQHFWNDDPASDSVGIQTHFVNAWRHVVRILDAGAAATDVLGLDPLNEPYPGSGYPSPCGDFSPCPAFEQTQLFRFYNRVIDAIRSTGDRHLIFPEGIAQNAQAVPSLPKFADPQTGFDWHYYCKESQLVPDAAGVVTSQTCAPKDAAAFANIVKYTDKLGVPWLVSEFGASDADAEYADQVDWMGSHFLSWMEWMYYQAVTDPGNIPGQGLLHVDALGASEANANQDKLDALVVPYAEVIAGTPESYSFDRSTRTMRLRYRPQAVPGAHLAQHALTRVFVPSRQYPLGYHITVNNGAVLSINGQWVNVKAAHPAGDVTITVTSAATVPSRVGGAAATSSPARSLADALIGCVDQAGIRG
jgi:endoglycosylceramidase